MGIATWQTMLVAAEMGVLSTRHCRLAAGRLTCGYPATADKKQEATIGRLSSLHFRSPVSKNGATSKSNPTMARLLLSSASPRFHATAAPAAGNGVPWLSVTSARPSARAASRMRSRTRSLSVRCEQGAKGGSGGLDVWLSRGAMLGFVGAVAVELTTGKGVLQNIGLTGPLPAVALGLTGVVSVFTAFLIFQSGSQD
ncbi:hypothetical protein U9M48_009040 [Paspalum notatum var. saurae]|uniref:Stress enhanced protein 1 n=1 Tax=Paspalum notatum var. saurae TaxID=547442 RepID=A0AAQ3WEM9_PASNO